MKKLALVFCLVLLSLFLGAQNNTAKLEELQQALDALQYQIGNEDTVHYRKIDVEMDILKTRNDSLIFKHDLLTLEVLLLQAKLSACEDNRNSLENVLEAERKVCHVNRDSLENVLEAERAVSFTKLCMDKENNLVERNLTKGSYVVLASFKISFSAEIQVKRFMIENPGLRLFVAQNPKRTWFHVCIDDPFAREESGQKVLKIRKKGYKNAWAIILN